MTTETLDRAYLEYSLITNARTKREIDLATLVVRLSRSLRPEASQLMLQAKDYLRRDGVLALSVLREGGAP